MNFFNSAQKAQLALFYESLITSFGKCCRLIYNEKLQTAPNPTTLVDTTYLGNTGQTGGPIESGGTPDGVGTGLSITQATEDIKLVIDWTLKPDRQYSVNVVSPYAVIRVHGRMCDFPKLQKANEVLVDLPIVPTIVGKYRMFNEGADIFSIVQGKFFVAFLERIS